MNVGSYALGVGLVLAWMIGACGLERAHMPGLVMPERLRSFAERRYAGRDHE